jgi:hypothetical protein
MVENQNKASGPDLPETPAATIAELQEILTGLQGQTKPRARALALTIGLGRLLRLLDAPPRGEIVHLATQLKEKIAGGEPSEGLQDELVLCNEIIAVAADFTDRAQFLAGRCYLISGLLKRIVRCWKTDHNAALGELVAEAEEALTPSRRRVKDLNVADQAEPTAAPVPAGARG